MKVMKRAVILVVVLCMFVCQPAYASELTWENAPGNHGESILLSANELRSQNRYQTVARGVFLSSGVTQITNVQDGRIRINIDTYAHQDVDRVFHTVFLDKWSEEDQDWYLIDDWYFSKSKEEVSDGSLHELETVITLSGYETNKYYRVRGLHGVEYNGEVEACSTETNGVLITDGPT